VIFSSAALAANVEATSTKLRVELPAKFVTAISAARELSRSIDYSAAGDQMAHAAVAALREGRDPTTDPLVQQYATARALHECGVRTVAESWSQDTIVELVREYADTIVAGWAEAIRPDLDVLQGAAGHLDQRDLNACDPVVLKRNNQLTLWADASSAAERADAALKGLKAILRMQNIGYDDMGQALLLAPDADIPTLTGIGAMSGRGDNAWTIARSGAPLRLPTPTEYLHAIARVTAERQEQQRQAEAEEAEAEGTRRRNRTRSWQPVPR
jgi:hypothetical protein